MSPFTHPSVLAPFVSTKPVRGTREQCDAYCSAIIDGAVLECTRKMQTVLKHSEGSHDLEDTSNAVRHLGNVAKQLGIPQEAIQKYFARIKSLYVTAKADHPTHSDKDRKAVRTLASNYATCHAYAHAIRDALHAATTARTQQPSPTEKPLHDTDPADIFAQDEDAQFVLSSDDNDINWEALEAENEGE